ncbi:hypothetical protein C8A05DRAFT_20436 [Staphylotrichum tortipilum]|uniref:C2H2-type domain-containing protein n=1 Tax=Staphylotrichum tortipilum TaxID=2831512 RepID=A0AAN6RMT9_9PEZI|nr:hypothetical protein C8A05DRAFT_20436 [Staphylotrichum longicolle]
MSTATASHLAQVNESDLHDPDEVFPRNSPLMAPLHPVLQLSPSPVISSPSSPVSPPPSPGGRSHHRVPPGHEHGYALLMGHLDGFRHEPASYVQTCRFALDSDEGDDPSLRDVASLDSPRGRGESRDREAAGKPSEGAAGSQRMATGSPADEDTGAFNLKSLKSLAAGALAAVTSPQPEPDAGPTPPVTENDVVGGSRSQPAPSASMAIHTRRPMPPGDERNPAHTVPFTPNSSIYSPRESGATPLSMGMDMRSPTASIHSSSHSEGLPPIQLNSPRYEANGGQTLPPFRSQFGDLQQLAGNHVAGNVMRPFPGSPPPTAALPRLPSLSHLASSPMPPSEPGRDPLSPVHSLVTPALSPGYYYSQPSSLRRPHDYPSSSTAASGLHQPGSPPAPPHQGRMGLDGMAVQAGSYPCKVPGCTAPPFQTQYLLNSHANVHSSSRPHYCPVPGCARGETGKGFKRKNEMIRHGLVHESPGYVCPFCPDRDHRYPRPDNLQRHVRVHHVDKDKDDPELREVLAQRPDGPNRGRRRRAGPS